MGMEGKKIEHMSHVILVQAAHTVQEIAFKRQVPEPCKSLEKNKR